MIRKMKKFSKLSLVMLLTTIMVLTSAFANVSTLHASDSFNDVITSLTINGKEDSKLEVVKGEQNKFVFHINFEKTDSKEGDYSITMPEGVEIADVAATEISSTVNEQEMNVGTYSVSDNEIKIALNEVTVGEETVSYVVDFDVTTKGVFDKEGSYAFNNNIIKEVAFPQEVEKTSQEENSVQVMNNQSENTNPIAPVAEEGRQDIAGMLTDMTWDSSIREDKDGNLLIRPGDYYTLTLKFQEGPGNQFSDSGKFSIKIPNGMKIQDFNINNEGTFEIEIMVPNEDNEFVSILLKDNSYYLSDNKDELYIDLNTLDKDTYELLTKTTNVSFNVWFTFTVDGDQTEGDFKFNDKLNKKYVIDDKNDLIVDKKYFIESDGRVRYEITVESVGDNEEIVITDTLSGGLLLFDENKPLDVTVEFYEKGGSTPSTNKGGYTFKSKTATGFECKIDEMKHREKYKFVYYADLDYSQITDSTSLLPGDANNTVKVVVVGEIEQEVTKSITGIVRKDKRIAKTGKVNSSTNEDEEFDGTRTVTWNIVINGDCWETIDDGLPVTDTITKKEDIVSYTGDGLTIEVFNKDGSKLGSTVKVSWAELGVDITTAKSWKIENLKALLVKKGVISANDVLQNKVVISYDTLVDVSAEFGQVTVGNDATIDEHPGGTDHGSVGVPGATDITVVKSSNGYARYQEGNKFYMEWTVKVKVPATAKGLDELYVTDILPYITINGEELYDAFDSNPEHITIEGLDADESWIVSENPSDSENDNHHTVTWTFYQDQAKTKPGLKDTGADREITITYRTFVNQDWYNSNTASHTHKNTAIAKSGTLERSSTASQIIIKKTLTKGGDQSGNFVIKDGIKYPIFKYTIQLTGIENGDEDFYIKDEFDTSKFELYPADVTELGLYASKGGTIFSSKCGTVKIHNLANSTDPEDAGKTGMILEVNLDEDFDFVDYNYYQIEYQLVPKDLETLMDLAKNPFTNVAIWDEIEDSNDVTYNPKPIEKTADLSQLETNRLITFTIEFNPYGKHIVEGSDITFYDNLTNLRIVDPLSLEIKSGDTVLSEDEYTYGIDNDVLTIVVKNGNDKPLTITYKALVIGNTADTPSIDYKNVVTVEGLVGESSSVSGTYTSNSGADGHASAAQIQLYKYVFGSIRTPLPGAEFRLEVLDLKDGEWKLMYEWDGTPCIYSTGEDGRIVINYDLAELYLDTKYRLIETSSPEGYTFNSDPIEFTISDTPSKDAYMPTETIYVSNRKEDFHIVKVDEDFNDMLLEGVEFTLYSDSNCETVVQKAISDQEGKASFHDLDTGTYYLKETKAAEGYVLPSPNPIYVVKVVAEEEQHSVTGIGTDALDFKTTKDKDGDTVFYATIKNAPIRGSITIEKTTRGATTPDNTTFVIEGPFNYRQEVTYKDIVDNNGKITFSGLRLGEYTITEVGAEVAGYDLKVFVTGDGVTVLDQGKVSVDITDDSNKDISFKNVYGSNSFTLKGTKTLTGRDLEEGQFEFEVLEFNEELDDYEIVSTGTNDTQGNIIFDKIVYTEENVGKHTYIVREVNGGKTFDGIMYDGNTFTVKVNVDIVEGVLVVEPENTDTNIVFNNVSSNKLTDLIIYKTGDGVTEDSLLVGAGFELYSIDENGKETLVGRQEGGPRFIFEGLSDGYYRGYEYLEPEGYEGVGSFYITIADGMIYIEGDETNEAYDSLTVVNSSDIDIFEPEVLGDQITEGQYNNWVAKQKGLLSGDDTVKSGDDTNIAGYMLSMILSLGFVYFLRRKDQEA